MAVSGSIGVSLVIHNLFQLWLTMCSCRGITLGLCVIGWVIAEAVPILNYLLSLMGSICFAPLSIIFPAIFWLSEFRSWMRGTLLQKGAWVFHILVVLIGTFLSVAGTYATAQLIIDAYASGQIGELFILIANK
jgi:Transmembrane amino acid transporter protein